MAYHSDEKPSNNSNKITTAEDNNSHIKGSIKLFDELPTLPTSQSSGRTSNNENTQSQQGITV